MEQPEDDGNVLNIRNHGHPDGACTPDGFKGDQKFFALNMSAGGKGMVFNGKLQCSDKDCTVDCVDVTDLQEGQCHQSSGGHGIQIWRSEEVLSRCDEVPQNNGPSPGPPGPPRPQTDSDPDLVAGLVGGGVALTGIIFGVAMWFRKRQGGRGRTDGIQVRYSAASRPNPQYERIANDPRQNPSYGTLTNEEEGMTTDI